MRNSRVLLALAVVLSVASGAVACSGRVPTADPGEAPLPAVVTCGTQYRPDAESLEGAEEREVGLERPGAGEPASVVTEEFETMMLTASYAGEGPEGRAFAVDITSSTGEPLLRALYQLGTVDLPAVDFAGGHGFTGLHYVGNEAAQLQFWCNAE